MRSSKFLIATFLLVSTSANADIFEPTIDKICSPIPTADKPSRVDPAKLVGRLFESQGLYPINLDPVEPNKIAYEQQVDAILSGSDFCARAGSRCEEGVAQKLSATQVNLVDLIGRHLDPVRDNDNGYQFPLRGRTDTATLTDFFLNPKTRVVAVCIAGKKNNDTAKHPAADNKSRAGIRPIVRKNIDDLPVGQSDPEFKSLQRASFQLERDQIKQTTTYGIEGVLGYGLGEVPLGATTSGELIPFMLYKRQLVSGGKPSKNPEIHDAGLGLLGDLRFSPAGLKSDLAINGKIVHSEVSGANIASGSLIYTPFPDAYFISGINSPAHIGDYWITLRAQGKLIYGEVLNNSGDPNLSSTETFSRLGSRLGLSIVADEDALLKGFSFETYYEYLKVLRGQFSQIARFESTITYTFPKQKFWNIQLQYVKGRDLDTLEQQHQVTLGIGLKY